MIRVAAKDEGLAAVVVHVDSPVVALASDLIGVSLQQFSTAPSP